LFMFVRLFHSVLFVSMALKPVWCTPICTPFYVVFGTQQGTT
jgi:hypothetical protein